MNAKQISRKKTIVIIGAAAFLSVVLLALKPLPNPTMDNCRKETGTVLKVITGDGEGDIVIKLKGDDRYYYINRGLNSGLSIHCLSSKLVNKQVQMLTIKHWTPLDPSSNTRHVAQIVCEGAEVYSEL